jgi:hypothetical protein
MEKPPSPPLTLLLRDRRRTRKRGRLRKPRPLEPELLRIIEALAEADAARDFQNGWDLGPKPKRKLEAKLQPPKNTS